jgi:hypothetical protein
MVTAAFGTAAALGSWTSPRRAAVAADCAGVRVVEESMSATTNRGVHRRRVARVLYGIER